MNARYILSICINSRVSRLQRMFKNKCGQARGYWKKQIIEKSWDDQHLGERKRLGYGWLTLSRERPNGPSLTAPTSGGGRFKRLLMTFRWNKERRGVRRFSFSSRALISSRVKTEETSELELRRTNDRSGSSSSSCSRRCSAAASLTRASCWCASFVYSRG